MLACLFHHQGGLALGLPAGPAVHLGQRVRVAGPVVRQCVEGVHAGDHAGVLAFGRQDGASDPAVHADPAAEAAGSFLAGGVVVGMDDHAPDSTGQPLGEAGGVHAGVAHAGYHWGQ